MGIVDQNKPYILQTWVPHMADCGKYMRQEAVIRNGRVTACVLLANMDRGPQSLSTSTYNCNPSSRSLKPLNGITSANQGASNMRVLHIRPFEKQDGSSRSLALNFTLNACLYDSPGYCGTETCLSMQTC